jgi:hypothetical protein
VQSIRVQKDGTVKMITSQNINPDSKFLSLENLEEI